MTNKNQSKEQILAAIKEWVAPVLLSIVGMLLWRDISEMRADVKLLLTNQSADRVKIEKLEQDVDLLMSIVFKSSEPQPGTDAYRISTMPAIKPEENYGLTVSEKAKRK